MPRNCRLFLSGQRVKRLVALVEVNASVGLLDLLVDCRGVAGFLDELFEEVDKDDLGLVLVGL